MRDFSDKTEVLDALSWIADGLVDGTYASAQGHLEWVLKEDKPSDGWSVRKPTDVQVLTVYLVNANTNEGSQ